MEHDKKDNPASALVSIIIPAYNASRFIRETLNSVLEQTYATTEIIVVDDGSSDDTREILNTYNEKITVVTQDNQGQAAARNRGARIAGGTYLSFVDADDVCDQNKIEKQVALLRLFPDAIATYCDFRIIDDRGITITGHNALEKPRPSGNILASLLYDNNISTPGLVLVKRSAWAEVSGFNEAPAHRGHEDALFWLKLALVGSFVYSPETLFSYRRHDMQETQKSDYELMRSFARAQRLMEIKSTIIRVTGESTKQFYRERLFCALIDAAWAARSNGYRKEAWRYAQFAICERPHSFAAWRSLLSSIAAVLHVGMPYRR